jgi:hypothetical protein
MDRISTTQGCGSASHNADPDPSFHFNADPDPSFHFDADLAPDPATLQSDANLRPMVCRISRASFWTSVPPFSPLYASTALHGANRKKFKNFYLTASQNDADHVDPGPLHKAVL